jgi:hypothetical protein
VRYEKNCSSVSTYPASLGCFCANFNCGNGKRRLGYRYRLLHRDICRPRTRKGVCSETSQQCVGAIKAVKGVIKEFGLCTFTRPDGDKIYVSYEATGQFGKGVKGNMTFVGGTGKCERMTGTGEFERKPLKGPVKGASASVSKSTYSWKIAAAK